jgi:hypothetical protein
MGRYGLRAVIGLGKFPVRKRSEYTPVVPDPG